LEKLKKKKKKKLKNKKKKAKKNKISKIKKMWKFKNEVPEKIRKGMEINVYLKMKKKKKQIL